MSASSSNSDRNAKQSTNVPVLLVLGGGDGAVPHLEPVLSEHGVEVRFAADREDAERLASEVLPRLCAVIIDTDFDGVNDGREVVNALRARDGRQVPAVFFGAHDEVRPRDLAFVIAEPLAAQERTCRLLLSLAAGHTLRH